jgi:hypothetical protein
LSRAVAGEATEVARTRDEQLDFLLGRPAIAPPRDGVILNGKQASTARSTSSMKCWPASLSPSRWEKVMRGLPKIEPSRFIISMIVSREPAGPADFPFIQAANWR